MQAMATKQRSDLSLDVGQELLDVRSGLGPASLQTIGELVASLHEIGPQAAKLSDPILVFRGQRQQVGQGADDREGRSRSRGCAFGPGMPMRSFSHFLYSRALRPPCAWIQELRGHLDP